MARERGRTFGIVGVGLLTVLAASSAGMPPAVVLEPAPPAPAGTTVTTVVLPVAPPAVIRIAEPPLPQLPMAGAAFPVAPPAVRPAPVARPVEPDITEPVTTVHRFQGRYLGGDKNRALIYVQTGPDAAEIQNRPLTNVIPAADADPKDDVRRIAVPAGAAVWHNGRAFLTTKRELLVIDPECRVDWKFTLPGKPDNGETLLGIAGFYEGKVVLAAQHEVPPGGAGQTTGRALTFDTATGRQVGFATVEGGFDAGAKLSLDARHGTLIAVTNARVRIYELVLSSLRWQTPLPPRAANPTVSNGVVFATTVEGVGMPVRVTNGFEVLARDATSTAPALFTDSADRAYLPLGYTKGEFTLAAYKVDKGGSSLQWWTHVPKAITTPPVVHGQSVYFVAGNALYRANSGNGAVCWKQTVPLKPGEALTELTFADGELRASGPGVLVRVAERTEPRPRDFFRFGQSLDSEPWR